MASVGVLPVAGIQIDYEEETEKITEFLSRYVPPPRTARRDLPEDDDEEAEEEDLADDVADLDVDDENNPRSKAKYMRVLRRVANRQTSEVIVDLADLRKVSPTLDPTHRSTPTTRPSSTTL